MGRPATILLLPLLTACAERDPLAPPPVVYGEDICDVCGMIITDERYAAAAVTVDADGEHRAVRFDDVGCLLAFERDRGGRPAAAEYVRDFTTPAWIALDEAAFVHSPELRSPMAHGVGACRPGATAGQLLADFPGDLLDVGGLRDRFAAGELAIDPRSTPPPPPPDTDTDTPPETPPPGSDGDDGGDRP